MACWRGEGGQAALERSRKVFGEDKLVVRCGGKGGRSEEK